MKPVLQVALDFIDMKRAVELAEEAVRGGCDWLEAGTPLIKSEGLNCVRELRRLFPGTTLVADMKVMDVGRLEVEIAAKAGANVVSILGCAGDETIEECVSAGRNYGAKILVDLIEVEDYIKKAKKIESMGVDYIGLHVSIDEQMKGRISFEKLEKLRRAVKVPLAVAGGINSETACHAVKSGASIIIVGGAITKSGDAETETRKIKKAIIRNVKIKSELYNRVTEKDVRGTLMKVSASNISDAMHRGAFLSGIKSLAENVKIAGPAVTVRTYPGDWAKPVEAIDEAKEGDVIVIDAGGSGPAVWGELASHSAQVKKISGVVINGAIRDTLDIRKLKFPAFAKFSGPQAGEPRGFGEINIPITIDNTKILPGDWIVGDDDGVVVIPLKDIAEITNRAMDVLEKENRVRAEIKKRKTTLGRVTELLKWEKK